MAYGDSLYIKTRQERNSVLEKCPEAAPYIKRIIGSEEFIHNSDRWGVWITDRTAADALTLSTLKGYVDRQYQERLQKKTTPAKLLQKPYSFREQNETHTSSLVVPAVSGEGYEYIPIGFIDSNTIVTNLVFVVYDCEPWIFGVVASRMHNLWIRAVCGQHETRTRYSNELGYNTFPFPKISDEQKKKIRRCVFNVIAAREMHTDSNLAQLYKRGMMPDDLAIAHATLDAAIEQCYREQPFSSDRERLDYLFDLYARMV